MKEWGHAHTGWTGSSLELFASLEDVRAEQGAPEEAAVLPQTSAHRREHSPPLPVKAAPAHSHCLFAHAYENN